MKKLFLLVLISFSFHGYAQNGALFQDWFLVSYEINEENYNVSDIIPHITPSLTIDTSLEFLGDAACNNYLGSFTYDDINDYLILDNFDATLNLCDYQTHNEFETSYFSFLNDSSHSYNIFWDMYGDEYLDLISSSGSIIFHYQTYPIIYSVNDNLISNTYIYPNPTTNNLYISSKNILIKKMTIYSISGKLIMEQNNNQNNSIDVSSLLEGVYFIEISSESGKSVKKFIKK